jgi:hypothetical protein
MPDWFEKGLRFECAHCGRCCRGAPGFVWVSDPEAVSIAGFLGVSPESFRETCTRRVGARASLVEKPNGDCVFWENGIGCRVYPVRPTQCRTFPFWKSNISTPEAWQVLTASCPGVGKGRHYRAEEIRKRAERTS